MKIETTFANLNTKHFSMVFNRLIVKGGQNIRYS